MLVMSRVNGGVHERQRVPFTRLMLGLPTASSGPGVKRLNKLHMHFTSIDEPLASNRNPFITNNREQASYIVNTCPYAHPLSQIQDSILPN